MDGLIARRLPGVRGRSVHTPHMFFMAAAGTAVLAMVSWAALREAQRMEGSFPTGRQVNVPVDSPTLRPAPGNGVAASVPRAQVVGDPAVAGADTAEALAAAAALWHVLVDHEPR